MQPGLKRSDPCPCGSGLKYKKCHGSATIVNGCTEIAQYMLLKLINKTRYDAGLIDGGSYERVNERAVRAMIDLATGRKPGEKPVPDGCYDDEPAPSSEELPKDMTELQKDLERCPKCGRPTFGKECIKCKRQEKNDE